MELRTIRRFQKVRSTVRWLLAAVVATLVALIPTRASMHDVAVGFPFTWRSRQEIVTVGEQPHNFSPWPLLPHIGLVLAFFTLLRTLTIKLIHARRAEPAR